MVVIVARTAVIEQLASELPPTLLEPTSVPVSGTTLDLHDHISSKTSLCIEFDQTYSKAAFAAEDKQKYMPDYNKS